MEITMRKGLLMTFVWLISATTWGTNVMSAENLVPKKEWVYFADTVMGGVSQGQGGYDQSLNALRLNGTVSTDNNGGFIQIRADLSDTLASEAKGIKLTVKGNGETYYIHLRNRSARLPWQYYSASFKAPKTWTTIQIPYGAFERSSSFMSKTYDPKSTKSLGIVAFGKNYKADLFVKEISTY